MISLLPIDVGFDLRVHEDMLVDLADQAGPDGRLGVQYMAGSEAAELVGPIADVAETLRHAGYRVRT